MWRQKQKDGTTQLVGGLTIGGVINVLYPVGSVILSTDSANPGTRFTGTTWVAFGAGRALVGVGNNSENTYTSEQAFGADSITLTAAQCGVNAHTHTSGASPGYTGTISADHSHAMSSLTIMQTLGVGTNLTDGSAAVVHGAASGRSQASVSVGGGSSAGVSVNHQHLVGSVDSATGATSHENRQKSVAVYAWKRTA